MVEVEYGKKLAKDGRRWQRALRRRDRRGQ